MLQAPEVPDHVPISKRDPNAGINGESANEAAIRAATKIGPVEIDYGDDNACEPLDVLKHLTSDHLKKKFGG